MNPRAEKLAARNGATWVPVVLAGTAWLAAMLLGAPRPLASSEPAELIRSMVHQPGDISEAGIALARAWGSGDVDQLVRLFSRQGIHLRLGGLDRPSLSSRLAEAAIRDFLRGFEQGSVHLVRTAPLAGQPQRGFAEFRWQTRVPGTSNAQTQFIFMGLSFEEGGWRVNEVRILP